MDEAGTHHQAKADSYRAAVGGGAAAVGRHSRRIRRLFPGRSAAGHVVKIEPQWRALTVAAGIADLRIHDLRHSFASQLVSEGASLSLIGALLGHSNPHTTHRYSHLFDDPLRAAVERVGAVVTAAGAVAEPQIKTAEWRADGETHIVFGQDRGRDPGHPAAVWWPEFDPWMRDHFVPYPKKSRRQNALEFMRHLKATRRYRDEDLPKKPDTIMKAITAWRKNN